MGNGDAHERQRATGRRCARPDPGELLKRYGRSYASEAGIRLADRPAPLYQLLVLSTLLSACISADIAEFPGIGPAGADIFLREMQVVWPGVAPYCDGRVLGAAKVGLPRDCAALSRLAGSPDRLAGLCAALVRVSRSRRAAEEVAAAASGRG